MSDEIGKRADLKLDLFETDTESDSLVEIKAYLRPDQLFGLELIERARQQRGNPNCDRAALVSEAIDLLIEKNILAIRLPREH